MPVEIKSPEEFEALLSRLSSIEECRVKIGYRRKETEEGTRRIKVLKVKARTPRRLYTIVFEDIDKGLEFAKKIKDKCSEIRVLDAELEGKI